MISEVWKPDLYFMKMVTMEVKESFRDLYFLKFDNNKNMITLSSEIDLVISCPMNFLKFPFDKHFCPLYIFDMKRPGLKKQNMRTINATKANWGHSEFLQFSPTEQDYQLEVSFCK